MPSSRTENRFGAAGYRNTSKQAVKAKPLTVQQSASNDLYAQYGVDPNSKNKADDLQAAITRAQYDDFNGRYSGWMKNLQGQVSTATINADKARWGADIAQSSDQAYKNGLIGSQLNQERFGVKEAARARDTNQSLGLFNQAKNRLSQTNEMTQNIDDRRIALLNGQRPKGGV